ncbi:MAG: Holliday junction resolvase RecU [Syntrophothermus sp.]
MNDGKKFENAFRDSVPEGIFYYRIKDSTNTWNNTSGIRFTPKNEFDCFLFKSPTLLLLELKSTKSTSFSFKGSSPMIKQHQIDYLNKCNISKNIVPGFILNFRNPESTYFLHIKDLIRFINDTTKSSINEDDIVNYGGIMISAALKRTRYKYNVEKFINECA